MIKQLSKNVHEVRLLSESYKDFDLWTLHCSDVHLDSPKCDRELFFKHCDWIKERNGKILIFGDLFDLMNGRFDPRRSQDDIREEYRGDKYLDLVIGDVYKLLLPYAENILFLSYGNHCNSVIKNMGSDPLQRLYDRLTLVNPNIGLGSYQGFLITRFGYGSVDIKDRGSRCKNITAYHHGHGGNAKRSKGMLENQIDGFAYPDADLIVKGHNHHKYYDPSNTRVKLKDNGQIVYDSQKVLRLGTYEQAPEGNGWAVEKGFLPPGMGGWFVNYKVKIDSDGNSKVELEVMEAK